MRAVLSLKMTEKVLITAEELRQLLANVPNFQEIMQSVSDEHLSVFLDSPSENHEWVIEASK